MGFTRLRDGRDGLTRNQALYDDVKGHRRSAGTFATEKAADRAWQRHGTLSAYAAVLAGQGRYDVNVSSACRTATHCTPRSSSCGASPVRRMIPAASCAHSASDSVRSSGAARTEQCHTGLSQPQLTKAASGWASSPARRRRSGDLPGRRSGSSSCGSENISCSTDSGLH